MGVKAPMRHATHESIATLTRPGPAPQEARDYAQQSQVNGSQVLTLADLTKEPKNLDFYQWMARSVPPEAMNDVLKATKEAMRRGIVEENKAVALFHFYLRRCARAWGLDLRFL